MARRTPAAGRLAVLALALLFVLPIVVAWWLNTRPDGAQSAVVSHGTLVPGAPVVHEAGLAPLVGQAPAEGYFTGHWTLLTVNPAGDCDLWCTRAIYTTRQVRWALGRHMHRVRRVVVQGPGSGARVRAFLAELAEGDASILVASASAAWHARLSSVLEDPAALGEVVFALDPEGRLVLFHSLDDDPGGLIEDMERLLRFAKPRIG